MRSSPSPNFVESSSAKADQCLFGKLTTLASPPSGELVGTAEEEAADRVLLAGMSEVDRESVGATHTS